MHKLIRGGEIELAFAIGLALKTVPDQVRLAGVMLSRRCEKIGQWSVNYLLCYVCTITNNFRLWEIWITGCFNQFTSF